MASIAYSPDTGVVVTGAASGIGRACALALAEAGRPVVCWDLNRAGVEKTAAEAADRFGVASHFAALDVSETARFPTLVDEAREALGTLGGLVHAAGVSRVESVDELDETVWDAVLDVNLRAYPLLVRALLPDLRANPGSAVVGIASINAILGNAANPAYGASKAGLLGASRSLADHLGGDGVRVNSVCPGYVRTPMLEPILQASAALAERMVGQSMLGRLAEPEEIAKVVRFLLSDDASYITAEELVVDGGVVRSQR
ncbi:MAG: SDR family NAD(P)-dependent oxidoreductase [Myxococcota bacterium]|nr:SDR family NAD(P)-dependent oxidoreductase [Myxococcota bacterium]